jgi:hypothetical protein
MVDRRSGQDRRRAATHPLRAAVGRGGRRGARRQQDRRDIYVDRYHPRLRYVAIGLLLLSILDAFLTLMLLEKGGTELNPLMQFMMSLDTELFLYSKLLLTAFGVAILVVHYHFFWMRVIPVAGMLYALLGAYVLLVNYEIYLLLRALNETQAQLAPMFLATFKTLFT